MVYIGKKKFLKRMFSSTSDPDDFLTGTTMDNSTSIIQNITLVDSTTTNSVNVGQPIDNTYIIEIVLFILNIRYYAYRVVVGVAALGICVLVTFLVALRYIKGRRRPIHSFIANMTIAQLLYLTLDIILYVAIIMQQDGSKIKPCFFTVLPVLQFMTISATEGSILGIAVDMLLAVVYPLKYRHMIENIHIVKIFIGLSWIVPLLMSIWNFIAREVNNQQSFSTNTCLGPYSDDWVKFFDRKEIPAKMPYIILAIVIVIIIILYAITFGYIRKSMKFSRESSSRKQESAENAKRQRKVVITTFIVLVINLVIFWGPYLILKVMGWVGMTVKYNEEYKIFWVVYVACQIMSALSPMLCPLVYAVRMTEISQGYKAMFNPLSRLSTKKTFNTTLNSNPNGNLSKKISNSSSNMTINTSL